MNKQLEQILKRMYDDKVVRKAIVKRRPDLFAMYYFEHYLSYEMAPFHKEMFGIMRDDTINLAAITGFRGSAKSTLMSLFFPIWSVLSGCAQFVLVIGKTQVLARQILKNIKEELEENHLLKKDMGPFETLDSTWGASVISLPKYHAQIMVASRDQAIRGIRHRQYRPQAIILDDIDDIDSVKSQESRDDTSRWFNSTILPLGTKSTKIILVGTPLHEDSLLMRLKKGIEAGSRDGVYKSYPILDQKGKPFWQAKFPNLEDIEKEKRRIGDEVAWQREYLLMIVSEENMVVKPEWIRYYKEMPDRIGNPDLVITLTGVDLAISKETAADFTAMVPISIFHDRNDKWEIYVHPYPINEKLYYPEARAKLKELSISLGGGKEPTVMYIEAVAYQGSMAQDLRNDNFPAEEFKVHGQDKRMRLSLVTHLIKDKVYFAERGNEILVNQLLGFGSERHDDMVDALAIALHVAMGIMTAPSMVFPKSQKPNDSKPCDIIRIKFADEWLADRELEFKQHKIDWPRWFACQDVAREVKMGIPWEIAMRYLHVVDEKEATQLRQLEGIKFDNKKLFEIFRHNDMDEKK